MVRTQIYLTDAEVEALEREARKTGRSKSQLIRDAVEAKYLAQPDARSIEAGLVATAGAWRRRDEDGRAYVARVRRGRLASLHAR